MEEITNDVENIVYNKVSLKNVIKFNIKDLKKWLKKQNIYMKLEIKEKQLEGLS